MAVFSKPKMDRPFVHFGVQTCKNFQLMSSLKTSLKLAAVKEPVLPPTFLLTLHKQFFSEKKRAYLQLYFLFTFQTTAISTSCRFLLNFLFKIQLSNTIAKHDPLPQHTQLSNTVTNPGNACNFQIHIQPFSIEPITSRQGES